MASGLDINGCVELFWGDRKCTPLYKLYTHYFHCSKVSFLQCCHMKRYNKISTKIILTSVRYCMYTGFRVQCICINSNFGHLYITIWSWVFPYMPAFVSVTGVLSRYSWSGGVLRFTCRRIVNIFYHSLKLTSCKSGSVPIAPHLWLVKWINETCPLVWEPHTHKHTHSHVPCVKQTSHFLCKCFLSVNHNFIIVSGFCQLLLAGKR